jgi:hypothetical protein
MVQADVSVARGKTDGEAGLGSKFEAGYLGPFLGNGCPPHHRWDSVNGGVHVDSTVD